MENFLGYLGKLFLKNFTEHVSKFVVVLALLGLTACNQINFKLGQKDENGTVSDPVQQVTPDLPSNPEEPDPDLPVDPDLPPPTLSSGSCQKGDSVVGCLSCNYDLPPPPAQALSKAQMLAKIQELTCPISNKSDPANKITPSFADLVKRLSACTAQLYPTTGATDAQLDTVNRLIGADPSLRNKMYSGLWYQAPYSDNFEYFFGVDTKEARNIFCNQQDPKKVLKGPLLTYEYYNYCSGTQGPNCWQWQQDAQAQARFNAAQAIRDQLRNCLDKPPVAPPTPPEETLPLCKWQRWEGTYDQGGDQQIASLLAGGYKVAIETSNSCELITSPLQNPDFSGRIKIAGYLCE